MPLFFKASKIHLSYCKRNHESELFRESYTHTYIYIYIWFLTLDADLPLQTTSSLSETLNILLPPPFPTLVTTAPPVPTCVQR